MYKMELREICNISKNKKVTILPHDNVDVDAAISCILLSKLLDFLSIKNEICIFDKSISRDTDEIMKFLGYDLSKYFVSEEKEEAFLLLVDHYETKHTGNVFCILDHHKTTSNISADIYIYRRSCAAAYIIYKLMLTVNMPIDKHIIELLSYAMFVDTVAFRSSKSVDTEQEEISKLIDEYGLNYKEIEKRSLIVNDIKSMTKEEIINNGRKDYIFSGYKVVASYIQLDKKVNISVKDDILFKIKEIVTNSDIYEWIFIFYNVYDGNTSVYYIFKDKIKKEYYTSIISRGEDVIPKIRNEIKHLD